MSTLKSCTPITANMNCKRHVTSIMLPIVLTATMTHWTTCCTQNRGEIMIILVCSTIWSHTLQQANYTWPLTLWLGWWHAEVAARAARAESWQLKWHSNWKNKKTSKRLLTSESLLVKLVSAGQALFILISATCELPTWKRWKLRRRKRRECLADWMQNDKRLLCAIPGRTRRLSERFQLWTRSWRNNRNYSESAPEPERERDRQSLESWSISYSYW